MVRASHRLDRPECIPGTTFRLKVMAVCGAHAAIGAISGLQRDENPRKTGLIRTRLAVRDPHPIPICIYNFN